MNTQKLTAITLLGCIIVLIVIYLLYKFVITLINLINTKETFYGKNGNSKRDKMIKIYKHDDILDPDENTNNELRDPDSDYGRDPDS
jgi:uncharacterized membrane protein